MYCNSYGGLYQFRLGDILLPQFGQRIIANDELNGNSVSTKFIGK